MIVRLATLRDIADLIEWGGPVHARYYPHVAYDPQVFAQTLQAAMTSGNMRVWLASHHERVCGLLIAFADRMASANAEYATDVLFVAERGGDQLLAKFMEWCDKRGVASVYAGVTQEDHPSLDKLYARAGLERAGGLYRKIKGGA